ncbi:hypothetical protein [Streptomyces chryseus]|uniref:hypothetical protein n=1 Tax=Streptomyces chryseus TaxID=68186 RepID=UPI00142EA421|nr:hypothetical protein [Streptomyces chryseus]GGX26770.1 hypothetical protein GCM10010353_47360 [Streptomyces chryseus]
MTKTVATIAFEEWAAQFERPRTLPNQLRRRFLRSALPHTYAPAVPETFRGSKWGMR